jgi:hypothetical protein
MRSDYYRQEKGVINIPPDKDKFHISWTQDNILCGFRKFYEDNGRWPDHTDNSCPYLPNVKTLQRKFGGITKIRSILGINDIDHRKGVYRSDISRIVGKRGFTLEEDVYKLLVDRFHEPFVHYQSRAMPASGIRVDFVVYHKKGKFAIDVFYPDNNKIRFSTNVSLKYKTYKSFPFELYLCVGNDQLFTSDIENNIASSKIDRNPNVILVGLNDFIQRMGQYQPLDNPYSK